MQQIKILIIDDEEDFCLLMKMYFSRINYSVQISYTLKTGLEMIDQYQPDILFLDNNLPDGHGWLCVNDIMKRWPNIQIHLISAFKPGTDHITNPANLRVWEKPICLEELQKVFCKPVTP
jgi:DNA-binding response OmpR family regulator